MPNLRQALAECRELACVHRAVLVGAGEMRHQDVDLERLDRRIGQFGGLQAEPVDAGVDHQVAGASAALSPQPRLPQAVDHRPDPGIAGEGGFIGVEGTVQDR